MTYIGYKSTCLLVHKYLQRVGDGSAAFIAPRQCRAAQFALHDRFFFAVLLSLLSLLKVD
jgi:hypothetical protein